MDLGIRGKRALVCGSSKGLGLGCATALAEAGVHIIMNARSEKDLLDSAELINNSYEVDVQIAVGDITSEKDQKNIIFLAGDIDILITNSGGPPPGTWADWDKLDFLAALESNMLTPIVLMKQFLPQMMQKGWGRIINITSQSVNCLLYTSPSPRDRG